jgi:hypothetical protein
LIANINLLKWLIDGDVIKLSDNWEYKDDPFDDIDKIDGDSDDTSAITIGLSELR